MKIPSDFASVKGYEDGSNDLPCNPKYKKHGNLETKYIIGWAIGKAQYNEGYLDGINKSFNPEGKAIAYFNGWDKANEVSILL